MVTFVGNFSSQPSYGNAPEVYIEGGDKITKLTAMAIMAEATNFNTEGYIENALEEALQDRFRLARQT